MQIIVDVKYRVKKKPDNSYISTIVVLTIVRQEVLLMYFFDLYRYKTRICDVYKKICELRKTDTLKDYLLRNIKFSGKTRCF